MLMNVSMVYYLIEFEPQVLQICVCSMFLTVQEGIVDYCNTGKYVFIVGS